MEKLTEIEELLSTLIGFNTSNPPGNEGKLAEFIRNTLRQAGAAEKDLCLLDHGNGRSSLVYSLPGKAGGPRIAFAGHLDTVPPGDFSLWKTDPFVTTAVEEGGRRFLAGRGAVDMRGGLCAMLFLAMGYLKAGVEPQCSLKFIFTADEESSGLGIRAVREAGFLEGLDFLVVAEPSGNRPGLAEKGLLWYRFLVKGISSHASMPRAGLNALELGFRFLEVLRSRLTALGREHPLLGKDSFALTMAKGGVKINVIPDGAEFCVDIRMVSGQGGGAQGVESLFRDTVGDFYRENWGLSIEMEKLEEREALEQDSSHGALRFLIGETEKMGLGGPVGINFFTDASLVIPYYRDLPFVILGPGNMEECHRPNEKIAPADIAEALEIYRRLVAGADISWFKG